MKTVHYYRTTDKGGRGVTKNSIICGKCERAISAFASCHTNTIFTIFNALIILCICKVWSKFSIFLSACVLLSTRGTHQLDVNM